MKFNVKNWHVRMMISSLTYVPAKPGVYIIGHKVTFENLEFKRIFVYIGQTNNLRRRMKEHSLHLEQNIRLRKYLKDNLKHAMCWYATCDKKHLLTMEKTLISKFSPEYNTRP